LTAYEILRARVLAFVAKNRVGPVEFARRMGYVGKSRNWGTQFIQGKRRIPMDRLDRAAEMLGVSVADLFKREGGQWSEETITVARAYEGCADQRVKNTVRVALGILEPARKEPRRDGQSALTGRRR
jgi:transcriptional regulator with XRE-family HTH domain